MFAFLRTVSWKYTALNSNDVYTLVHKNILRIIFKGVFPFFTLLFANIRLIWMARKLKMKLPQSRRIGKLKYVYF